MNGTDGWRAASVASSRASRGLLAGVVAPPVLPDMVQDRHPPLGGEAADRVEERVVRPAAGRQLDADHARVETASDLRQRIVGVVGIHRDVAPDATRMLALQVQEAVVAEAAVGGRGEVGR